MPLPNPFALLRPVGAMASGLISGGPHLEPSWHLLSREVVKGRFDRFPEADRLDTPSNAPSFGKVSRRRRDGCDLDAKLESIWECRFRN